MDKLLSHELAHIRIGLPVEGHFDDFWTQWRQLPLVLHESADAALLVPDEEVFVRQSCIGDSCLELLQVVRWP